MGEINIKTGEIIQGDLPDRALRMVREWISDYRGELQIMWDTQMIKKLPPLA